MKTTTSVLLAGLLSMIVAAASAQTGPVAQIHQDDVRIHQQSAQIRQDVRQVQHDKAVVAVKQADVAAGKQQLQAARGERNALQRAENAELKKGDIAGARQLGQQRRVAQQAVKVQKQAIRHDHKIIAQHRADQRQAVQARRDERLERHAAVVRRDRDSAKI